MCVCRSRRAVEPGPARRVVGEKWKQKEEEDGEDGQCQKRVFEDRKADLNETFSLELANQKGSQLNADSTARQRLARTASDDELNE